MNELRDNKFVQDRMVRNNEDYCGSGVGTGRYDAGSERAQKIKDMILPLVLLAFMAVYWIVVFNIAYEDLYHKFNSIKYVVEFDDYQEKVTIELPDGTKEKIRIPAEAKGDDKLTIYYNEEDGTIYIHKKRDTWVLFSAFGAVVTLALLYWIKTILFRKKHAVEKKVEHSYKDY